MSIYEENLVRILGENKRGLFIFYGFNMHFYEFLQANEERYKITHILDKNFKQYVNINEIEKKEYKKKLNIALMSLKERKWMFYEEFISALKTMSDFSLVESKIFLVKNNLFNEYYPLDVDCLNQEILDKYQKENFSEDDIIFEYYSDCVEKENKMYFSYVNKYFPEDCNYKIKEIPFYKTKKINIKVDIEKAKQIELNNFDIFKDKMQRGEINNVNFYLVNNDGKYNEIINILNYIGGYFEVCVGESKTSIFNKDKDKYTYLLKEYWGEDAEFRDTNFYIDPLVSNETIPISQGALISDIIDQCNKAFSNEIYSDIIITAPTGAGKSILFQIPGAYLSKEKKALTIVICPLIALMVDQVKELNDRGIEYATFINSDISYDDRMERLEGVKKGKYSIVYLSPELLLCYTLDTLIGEREVGLLVVDEAHLVTSWGRDFRVDYWFLGDYLYKVRNSNYHATKKRRFPVLCLTATAVYGGNDDVIFDLQESLQLNCQSDHLYLGYVRRKNIEFDIRKIETNKYKDREQKYDLTMKEIEKVNKSNRKTIIYFPYKKTINDLISKLEEKNEKLSKNCVKYYGGENITSQEKDIAYNQFRNNDKKIMLSTKAFGMGVNISDIEEVYHFAPTGTLADYVQEIGRAARKIDKGYAVTDYLPTDMSYVKTLWGLSGIKQYQLRDMVRKIYEIYNDKKQRNLLITPDTFDYLFDEEEIENKVKSGLMLLKSDFLEKYHFKVLVVRPKSLFAYQYICIPYTIENKFLAKYGKYVERIKNIKEKTNVDFYGHECAIKRTGNIYEANLGKMWEELFSDKTFAQFKYEFFSKKLFDFNDEYIVPNVKITIDYIDKFNIILEKFTKITEAIQQTFEEIREEYGQSQFKLDDFYKIFTNSYKEKIKKEYVHMLLELFCYEKVYTNLSVNPPAWKFIAKKKKDIKYGFQTYSVLSFKSSSIKSRLDQYIRNLVPNVVDDAFKYEIYESLGEQGSLSNYSYIRLIAQILQIFKLGNYEMSGGKNPEIFIRINDPIKLRSLIYSKYPYKNKILLNIKKRHERAVMVVNKFLSSKLSNEKRWDIIEEYFLGKEDVVKSMLKITDKEGKTIDVEEDE